MVKSSRFGLGGAVGIGAIAAAAAVAVGVSVYSYVYGGNNDSPQNKSPERITRAQVIGILKEIHESQRRNREGLHKITHKLAEGDMSLKRACDLVSAMPDDDPLKSHGISVEDFDMILERFQQDKEVNTLVDKLLEAPTSRDIEPVPFDLLLEMHKFMLSELQQISDETEGSPAYSHKVISLAVQAAVTARAEAKFKIPNERVEASTAHHFDAMNSHHEFSEVIMQIQVIISRIVSRFGGND